VLKILCAIEYQIQTNFLASEKLERNFFEYISAPDVFISSEIAGGRRSGRAV
jgi:hypothetical protein